MILIVSNNNEMTTDEVISWLIMLNKKFIRVHEDEIFMIKTSEKRIYIESERNCFFIDEICSVWYRRGGLKFHRNQYEDKGINHFMNETQHWLEDYIRNYLENKKHINKESTFHINKLIVLDKAKELGFDVPDYFLAENTDNVDVNKTIVKTITGNGSIDFEDKKTRGVLYTNIITDKENEDFFITFFQEKIEKDYEIRSFFLNGKIWSMAIFSQNDEKTKIDYRNYNHEKPNRNVRYNLPVEIETKIIQLMNFLDLNCGSLDFMKSSEKFYFLEVNPVGQLGALSTLCNYGLDKEIACAL